MKNVIATTAPITRWGKDNGKQITLWHRGDSWYIGIKHADCTCTILHAGKEKYIRGVWRDRYVERGW